MTESAADRLEKVRASIDRVLQKGQRFRKGDRQIDNAELASLRVMEGEILKEVAREKAALAGRSRNRVTYGKI
ncbi:hypothetical protein [Pseudomonas knackmussii]|uniref:hypothetical protein n=1 Tax=Pseudomonas knackmussii TaxID=65741 RepID=UPI001363D3A8|nr:hypothetical protein [Pseudomonas knackmussii]